MQTYRVTARSTAFETVEVQANSAKEAEQMVQEAFNAGKAFLNPEIVYIGPGGEDDWTVCPEYAPADPSNQMERARCALRRRCRDPASVCLSS
jgi:hypothetical protein